MSLRRLTSAAAAATLLSACTADPTRPAPAAEPEAETITRTSEPPVPTDSASGSAVVQMGTSGSVTAAAENTFTTEIQVRVFRGGTPAEGEPVDFTVTAGGGTVSPARALTDAHGDARTTLTFPANVENVVEATSALGAHAVTTVAAYTSWRGLIRPAAPGFASARAGTTLPEPLVFQVLGRDGLPLAGRLVRFTTLDGSSASPAEAVTDAEGRVQTRWTLAPAPGLNRLKVTGDELVPYLVHAVGSPR